MPAQQSPRRRGRIRRLAHLVYEEVGLSDPPVISGLVDIESDHRWRHRP